MSTIVQGLVDAGFKAVDHVLEVADKTFDLAENSVVDAAEMALRVADATVDMTETEVLAFAKAALERAKAVVDKAIEPLP